MEIFQILKEDGSVPADFKTDLSKEQLLEIYETMILTRLYDERSNNLQRQGRIGFYIGCKGQEASHIASGYALDKDDWVMPAYREPGILFLRGVPIKDMICQMIGNGGEATQGRQMPCHFTFADKKYGSISSPLATQIPHAVGLSFAAKLKKDKMVSITYFGDGSTSEGDFHVGLNFAGVYKTPTIFFCQNNRWAISVPFEKQTASGDVAIKGQAYGVPSVKVDGNDVFAVYQVTKEAAEKARNGGGPTLIEACTYRIGPHSSSDDDTRYRPEGELEEWKAKDPILRFELYLKNQGILNEEKINNIHKDNKEKLNQAIVEAEKEAPPRLSSMFEDVYKEMPKHLEEQMNDLISEQKRLGESENRTLAFPL